MIVLMLPGLIFLLSCIPEVSVSPRCWYSQKRGVPRKINCSHLLGLDILC